MRTLVRGLTAPTAVAFAPDGRIFVAEQSGRVLVASPGNPQPAVLLDLSAKVNSYFERGMNGIAVDSAFASNGYLYLAYTYERSRADDARPAVARLTRVKVSPANTAGPETVVLGRSGAVPCPPPANGSDCLASDSISHSIGAVRSVGGTLWVAMGDGAELGREDPRAFRVSDPRSLNGKLLHVSRDGRGLPGHPFCRRNRRLTDNCTKVHAKGFRNPFRFSLGPGAVLAGDVGAGFVEEIDRVRAGRDYGWPCFEGSFESGDYDSNPRCRALYALDRRRPATVWGPALQYRHNFRSAVVVAGPIAPASFPAPIRGRALFADFVRGQLSAAPLIGATDLGSPLTVGSDLGNPVALERRGASVVYVNYAGRRPGTGAVCEIHPAPGGAAGACG